MAERNDRDQDRAVRRLRSVKPRHDPWRAQGWSLERERLPAGGPENVQVLAAFLTGAECPFTCTFCDLWRHTLDGPTPPGALPAQLAAVLGEAAPRLEPGAHVKLYNASNFFDSRAVPPADEEPLAALLAPFPQVVVESHPRLLGRRAAAFARRLAGRLQVAMGLETVHPEAARRLNKGSLPEDFARAAGELREQGMGLRAFVLVGAPWVPPAEDGEWVARSVRFAFDHGAEHVSLIPVRGGNGALEELARRGRFAEPTLAHLERCFEACLLEAAGVLTVDTWDLPRFAACSHCRGARIARLKRMSLSGRPEPRPSCQRCGGRPAAVGETRSDARSGREARS